MDVINKPIISLKQQNDRARANLRLQLENFKNQQGDFHDRFPRTSRHQNTYLSPVKRTERKIGANRDVEVTVFEFTKSATHNERVVVLSGKEHLSYPLSNREIGHKSVVAASPKEMYVFHRVPAEVSSDGSSIDPENVAVYQLEHSEFISNVAARPSLNVKTREREVYLGSQTSGEVALDAEEVVKFDIAKLNEAKLMEFEEAIVNLIKRAHTPEKSGQPGISLGGVNPASIQFDKGEAKLLNSLSILPLDEENVDREFYDALATVCACGGGSTLEAMQKGRERLFKKMYERSVVTRHAMREKSKGEKKPYLWAAEKANTLARYL